jgi:protocatechuate 3,4-dioxygenase beta subunit
MMGYMTAMDRRQLLKLLGGGAASVVVLAACGSSSKSSSSTTTPSTSSNGTTGGTTGTTAAGSAVTTKIPEETAGPFPGDGSNGPDVLSMDGVVRKDITKSIGDASGVADGVPLTIRFTVLDLASGAAPLAGAAVYAWHCDRDGAYSMYNGSASGENYLRGVQSTDKSGIAEFTSIFPAAYDGRWPHIHFDVYESVDAATNGGTKLATSQIASPEAICDQVYATDGYEQSVQNMQSLSLETDMVFRDGWTNELGSISGTPGSNLTVALAVPV